MGKVSMKPIPGFENYSVTEDGRVWSHKRITINNQKVGNIWRKPWVDKEGYALVGLGCEPYLTGKGTLRSERTMPVHVLVAMAYIREPNKDEEVNHKDGNKANNHYKNLEWITHSNNMKHAADKLRSLSSQKLTKQQVKYIKSKTDWKYGELSKIARKYGVTPTLIFWIKNGRVWNRD